MSIYVWNSEIKNIYIWTTAVKSVYVWTTKVRPATITVTDVTTTSQNVATFDRWLWKNFNYWIKLTALKTGKIKAFTLLNPSLKVTGTLKIAEWQNVLSLSNEKTYSITSSSYSSAGKYTLSTPYNITAWNNYVIMINAWNQSRSRVLDATMPTSWTAVRYDYWSSTPNGYTIQQFTYIVYDFRSFDIEYMP